MFHNPLRFMIVVSSLIIGILLSIISILLKDIVIGIPGIIITAAALILYINHILMIEKKLINKMECVYVNKYIELKRW